MYGYIYKTTNLINGKIYIGQHKADKFDLSYYGSGKHLINAINYYGVNNFKCELIEWCETQSVTNSRERYWIKYYNSRNKDIGYNITEGGEGWKGGVHTEETKLKISKAKTGASPNREYITTDDTKLKISNTLKSYYKSHDNPRKGAKLSDTTKQKLRDANLGKKLSVETIAKMQGRPAWNKGKHLTEKEKQHLREVNLGKKYGEATKQKHRDRWLGSNNPNFGGLSEQAKQKLRDYYTGRIWVTNGIKSKQILPEELQDYLDKGYVRGRKIIELTYT